MSLRDISRAVRTRQWAKNGLLFAGFLFAGHLRGLENPAHRLVVAGEILRVLLAFTAFCALSGAAYVINDWRDIERDRLHPIKKNRPLAAGRISKRGALALIVGCLIIALVAAMSVALLEPKAWLFPIVAASYLALTLAYSFVLKNEVIVDVLVIAAGFVLRMAAGCLAIPVPISEWIVFCTFTLALFVALCKRRAELLEMGENSEATRRVLPLYSVPLLDTFIGIAAGLTITSYSLYTFLASQSTAVAGNHQSLMITIPFVVYGIFRFLLLAHSSAVGGEPEQLLRDKPLMINMLFWAILVAVLTLL